MTVSSYWKGFDSGIIAWIGFGLEDEKGALAAIEKDGYYNYSLPRIVRPA